jgi:hypothetical protein
MALKFGGSAVSALYAGSDSIAKAYLGATQVFAGGASPYVAPAVHFDGNTTLINPSLGGTDGPCMGFSVWMKSSLFNGIHAPFGIPWVVQPVGAYNNVFEISDNDPALGGSILVTYSPDGNSGVYTALAPHPPEQMPDDTWHSFIGGWDTNHDSGSKIMKVYIDTIDVTGALTDYGVAYIAAMTGVPFYVGGDSCGAQYIGDMADFWLATNQSLFDISGNIPLATLRKFVSSLGKPVDLGANGETPTGVVPNIFLSGNATTFPNNLGTGGAFTTFERAFYVTALAAPGSISLPGGVAGQTVTNVFDRASPPRFTGVPSDFETTISVNDHIQQIGNSIVVAGDPIAISLPSSVSTLTNASTSPSD